MRSSELERLALLAEECAEVIHCVSKAIRHGYEAKDPTDKMAMSNRGNLEREIGHVLCAIHLMASRSDVLWEHVVEWDREKAQKVRQYLHYQEEGEK